MRRKNSVLLLIFTFLFMIFALNFFNSSVHALAPPVASFTVSPSIPVVNNAWVTVNPVTFNASMSTPNGGVITSYFWDFNDSTNLTTTDPVATHTYAAIGNYTVTLTVRDSEGLNNTASEMVQVAEMPTATFTYSPTAPYVGDNVTFDASNSSDVNGYIASYIWDFGDGNALNTTSPITHHTYGIVGNYTVKLTVIDNLGLSNSTSLTLSVSKSPVAIFTFSPGFPIAGETVTFDASASINSPQRSIANYTWNFGDGNTTVTANPSVTHIYVTEGSYTLRLVVTDTSGYNDTSVHTVAIRNYPVAAFLLSPDYPIRNQTTMFNASSSQPRGGINTSYDWDFGDGSGLNTTNPVANHTFAAVGTYNVTLTVADSEGLTGNVTKTVKVRDYPTANFTWSPSRPMVTQPVAFNASTSQPNSGVITGYTWNFGDGNVTSTTDLTLSHSYKSGGNYAVTLTVANSEGLNASTTENVTVLNTPSVSFYWSPYPYALISQPTVFNASSSSPGVGTIAGFTWNFGDGNTTTTTNPIITHLFDATGSYNVTLTAINSYGLYNSTSSQVDLYGTPQADFTWTPTFPMTNQTITFSASNSKPNGITIVSYTWNFSDGTPPALTTGPTTTHQFAAAGTYNVTLAVTNNAGLVGAISKGVIVVYTPTAEFMWTPATPYAYDIATFIASFSSSGGGVITNYVWNFGDGNVTATSSSLITHSYLAGGDYTVALNVTSSYGLFNVTSKTISIAPAEAPTAGFTYSPLSPGVYEGVAFDASDSVARGGVIADYYWDFGDGTSLTAATSTVYHNYQTAGNFSVALDVTNTAGYLSTATKQIAVTPISGPSASFTWFPIVPHFNQTVKFDASASSSGWNGTTHSQIVNYTWDFGDNVITSTTGQIIYHAYSARGNYTVNLRVTASDGGIGYSTENLTATGLIGDLNGDGKVDMRDIATVAAAFGSSPGRPRWNPISDVNGDGRVDMRDIATVARRFGESE